MANLKIPGGDKNSRILLDQINARPRQFAITDGKIPSDIKSGDTTSRLNGTSIIIGQSDGKQVQEFSISKAITQYLPLTTSTTDASILDVPNDGDWAWHYNSTTGTFTPAYNYQGTVEFAAVINPTQHGNQSSGDLLHVLASSTQNGFMAKTDKVILDAATSALTPSAIVKRDANNNFLAAGILDAPVTKTATYTATLADSTIICDSTAGIMTINLPTAIGISGKEYTFKKINAVGNVVTIDPFSTQTIDGAATITFFTQWDFRKIKSDGANWLLIGSA